MQANMSPHYISFCKIITRSHLSGQFYLYLPKEFCKAHLPCHDKVIILVDVSEEEYNVIYSVEKYRLMHGWKNFAIAHGLLEGDTLAFHLIGPCKFKVHITRASRSIENEHQKNNKPVDFVEREDLVEENGNTATQEKMEAGATDELSNLPSKKDFDKMEAELKAALDRNKELQMQLDVSSAHVEKLNEKFMDMEKGSKSLEEDDSKEDMMERMLCRTRKMLCEEMLLKEKTKHVYIRKTHRSTETNVANGNSNLNIHDSPDDDENTRIVKKELPEIDVHQETTTLILDWDAAPLSVKNSESALNFEEVKGFEDFKIHVNGEILDSEIPVDIRMKYYQLCCSQKKFLHGRGTEGRNTKLVVAMILEIVSIADSTKAASISTPVRHLESMDKTLKSFEDLGMTVGLLRAKIGKLIEISSAHCNVAESTRVTLEEIESERRAFLEKKSKIDELIECAIARGELIGHLEGKIGGLKEKMDKLSLMFNAVAKLYT